MKRFAVEADHRSLARLRRIEKSCAAEECSIITDFFVKILRLNFILFKFKPRLKIILLYAKNDYFSNPQK